MRAAVPAWLRVAVAMTAVGWGANHFASLLLVYRDTVGLSEAFVSLALGFYAAGLIPALLVSAAVADRFDRRLPVRVALLLSMVGSVLLMTGAEEEWLLLAGRFVAGVATGTALGPGTAWIMDLSRRDGLGVGARRATVAVSLGFGGGPLVAGLLAEWAPAPAVLPYAAHLLISVPAVLLAWGAPLAEDVRAAIATSTTRRRRAEIRATLLSRDFLLAVPLTAPWVFGTAITSFAIVPTVLTPTHLPVATAAVVTGLTLGTGVLVQPLAKRAEHRATGSTLPLGLALAAVGLAVAATAFAVDWIWLLLVIAVLLGAAYGLLLVGGLSRVERLSHPDDRATINAVFYAFTYLGFAAPYVVVLVSGGNLTPGRVLLGGAGVAVLTAVLVGLTDRRRGSAAEPAGAPARPASRRD